MNNPYGYGVAPPQQQQQQHAALLPPTNIDPALEGVVKSFMRSEKYGRKIKNLVRATSVPGRQNYKFAPATALTQQETRLWRNNLMQDEIASNNPFWTARWMRVFGIAPKLDDSLLKVPWIKCERPGSVDGDARSSAPLHRKETYLDLRDEQNRNWAMDSFTSGIDCAQKGQLEDAIKAYTQAIQIDAKCVEAYVARGCTFANIKKWRAAIMDFRAALNLDPSNISARQYLETTIAQEEEHRLNPSVDAHAAGVQTNSSNTTAFGGDANLDDINEIVLDTDVLHNVDGRNDNKGNNNERKKKKKKGKGKKRNHYDGTARPRDMGRDRDDGRDRSRGRSRDRSPDRSRDRRDRDRSRDRNRDKDDNRYSTRPTRRAGSRSRSRSPRTRSKSGSRSRSRTRSVTRSRRRSRSKSPGRVRSIQRSLSRLVDSRKKSRSRSPSRHRSTSGRQARGGSQYRPDNRSRDGKENERSAAGQIRGRSVSRSTSRSRKDSAPDGMQNRGRSPPPQNRTAVEDKGWPKEKEVPAQEDYSPNVNYDYSPDIQYDHSPKLERDDRTSERQEPKASLEADKHVPEPSAKVDSTDKGESQPVKDFHDTKETNAVIDNNGTTALSTLEGPLEDTKKAESSEVKDHTSTAVGTTAERRRSRSRSRTRDRNSTTRRTRSRSFDREKTNISRRGRSSRSPARNKVLRHGRSRSRSDSRSRNTHPRSKETNSKDANDGRTARSQSNGGSRVDSDSVALDKNVTDQGRPRQERHRPSDRSRSPSRSRRNRNRSRSRSKTPVRNNRGGSRSESKGRRGPKRTKSRSPVRSGGGGGGRSGRGKGGGGGGGGGGRGKVSGANKIAVSKDFMEQRKRMRMRKSSQS